MASNPPMDHKGSNRDLGQHFERDDDETANQEGALVLGEMLAQIEPDFKVRERLPIARSGSGQDGGDFDRRQMLPSSSRVKEGFEEIWSSGLEDRFLVGPCEERGRAAVVSFEEEGYFNEELGQEEIEMETLHRYSVRQDSYMMALEKERDQLPEQHELRTASMLTGRRSRKAGMGRPLSQHEMEISVDDLVERSTGWVRLENWRWKSRRVRCVCLTTLVTCLLLLLVTLLPAGLVYVEYYEMALLRNTISGRVDRQRTYYPGCYLLVPGSELIRFRGTAHTLDLTMEVRTSDNLALNLTLSLQYFINGEELGALHSEYEHEYNDVVRSVVVAQTKVTAAHFSLRDLWWQRVDVERDVYTDLSKKLQGDCCPSVCPVRWSRHGENCSTCSRPPLCERGFHVILRPEHVQLGDLQLPSDLADIFLKVTLLQVETEKEGLIQEMKVETKLNKRLTQAIYNEAREIRAHAAARSQEVDVAARAFAEQRVQGFRVAALRALCQQVNVTREDHRLSLFLMLTFLDNSDNLFLAGHRASPVGTSQPLEQTGAWLVWTGPHPPA